MRPVVGRLPGVWPLLIGAGPVLNQRIGTLVGMLAGALWYLHFRIAEKAADDVARSKAVALGLKTEKDGAQTDLWVRVFKKRGSVINSGRR